MEMVKVKLSELQVKNNPRYDFTGIEMLAKSIDEMGLIQPITARRVADNLEVVDGERRLRALKLLKQTETQVVVLESGEDTIGAARLVANVMRSGLNVLELGAGWSALMKNYPAKFNETTISRVFAVPAKRVARFVYIARSIPEAFYSIITPMLPNLTSEDLELIAKIPGSDNKKAFLEKLSKSNDMNIWRAVNEQFKRIDFSDAFGYEKAKASPDKCFILENNGLETIWTVDEKFYLQSKTEYEKANPKKAVYGKKEEEREIEHKVKTDKEIAADRVRAEKKRKGRAEALQAIETKLEGFLGDKKLSPKTLSALGHTLCETYLTVPEARMLFDVFKMKHSQYEGAEVKGKLFEKVLSPFVLNGEGIVALYAFLIAPRVETETLSPEEVWAKGLSK